jgi:hypothetical protein
VIGVENEIPVNANGLGDSVSTSQNLAPRRIQILSQCVRQPITWDFAYGFKYEDDTAVMLRFKTISL